MSHRNWFKDEIVILPPFDLIFTRIHKDGCETCSNNGRRRNYDTNSLISRYLSFFAGQVSTSLKKKRDTLCGANGISVIYEVN